MQIFFVSVLALRNIVFYVHTSGIFASEVCINELGYMKINSVNS